MGPLPFSCWSATGHSFSFPPHPLTSLPPALLHHLSSYPHPPHLPVLIIHLSFCPLALLVLLSHPPVLSRLSFCSSVILSTSSSSSSHPLHSSVFFVHLSFLSSYPSHPPVFLSSCHSIHFTLLSSCSLNPPCPPILLSYLSSFSTCYAGVL